MLGFHVARNGSLSSSLSAFLEPVASAGSPVSVVKVSRDFRDGLPKERQRLDDATQFEP